MYLKKKLQEHLIKGKKFYICVYILFIQNQKNLYQNISQFNQVYLNIVSKNMFPFDS